MTASRIAAQCLIMMCMSFFMASGTQAQTPPDAPTPLDTLQSSGADSKGYSYELEIEYAPGGTEGLSVDEQGPYAYTRQTRRFIYSGTFAYDFNDALSLFAQAAAGSGTTGVQRTDADGQTWTWQERHNGQLQPSFGLSYRFLRDSAYAPTLSAAGRGGHLQGGLSFSHVRDPTVFSASIGHTWSHGKADDLLLSVSAGFVANDRVTFSLQASHGVPSSKVHPPWTTIEMRAVHSVGDAGIHDIGVGLTLSMHGDHPSVGLRMMFAGRSP